MREAFEGEGRLFAVSQSLLLSGVDATGCHRGNAHPVSNEQDYIASDVDVDRSF